MNKVSVPVTITGRNLRLFWQTLIGNNMLAIALILFLWQAGYWELWQNFIYWPFIIIVVIILIAAFLRGFYSALKARQLKTMTISPALITFQFDGKSPINISADQVNSIRFVDLNFIYKSIFIDYQGRDRSRILLIDPTIFDKTTIEQVYQALKDNNYKIR